MKNNEFFCMMQAFKNQWLVMLFQHVIKPRGRKSLVLKYAHMNGSRLTLEILQKASAYRLFVILLSLSRCCSSEEWMRNWTQLGRAIYDDGETYLVLHDGETKLNQRRGVISISSYSLVICKL